MRVPLVLVMLCTTSSAAADPKAIATAVRTNIVELGKHADDDKLALATDAIVIGNMGRPIVLSTEDDYESGAVAKAFYGGMHVTTSHKPGAITQGADRARGVAWFQAPFTVTMVGADEDGNSMTSKERMRIGGIVARRGATWEIIAAMYVEPVSDKVLLSRSDGEPATGAPKLAGDAKLAGVVAGWFTSGFAPAAARSGTLIASGTAPTELATTRPAATRLVKRWDKLKLRATKVEAKLLANGAIGWVIADVWLPRKRGKGAVHMKLAAVVVPDGASWRWVSLQYQPPFQIGR